MRFTKMHGAGNDYVYVNCFEEKFPADVAKLAIEISDRHFGVGGDVHQLADRAFLAGGDHLSQAVEDNDGVVHGITQNGKERGNDKNTNLNSLQMSEEGEHAYGQSNVVQEGDNNHKAILP